MPTPPPSPGAERLLRRLPEPPGTTVHPVPEGKTVQTDGTRVYFRDADGKLTPAPDGDYRLPNGRIMRARGGENRGNSQGDAGGAGRHQTGRAPFRCESPGLG